MTTQYTSILKLALPVQGELSGTWGDVVNDNITSMVEEAVAGRAVINTWTTNSHTLTTADGTTSESRCAMLEFTDTGAALTGAATVVCPSASKLYVCKNDSGQQVTIQTAAGTGVAIPDGQTMFVFCDGTNVEQCETNFNSLSFNGYTLNFGGAVTTAGAFTTSGAYALTLTTTGATNVTLPTTGTLATLDGTETLTNKTLTAPTISSPTLTGSISATDLTISGNTTIGDAAADTLTVNGTITSNLIFTDDTYDIGAVGATRPRNLYLSGNATIGGTVTLSGGIDVTGALGVDGDFDVNTDKFTVASATGNTVVAGTLGVTGITTATGGLNADTISEITSAAGVAVDSVVLKDGTAGRADASGTDAAGVNFTLKGGASTGSGVGGGLVFQTTPAGSTGSSVNAHVTALTINGEGASTFDNNVTLGDGTNRTPTTGWDGQLNVDGSGYTGGISLDANAMWVGHNSGSRDLYLSPNENAFVQISSGGSVLTTDSSGNTNTSISAAGGAVFNQFGNSVDFRVESANNEYMLFVDGSADAVAVGTSQPLNPLHVSKTNGTTGQRQDIVDVLMVEAKYNGGDGQPYDGFGAGISFRLETYDQGDQIMARIAGRNSDSSVSNLNTGRLDFQVADAPGGTLRNYMTIGSPGATIADQVRINPDAKDHNFTVETLNYTDAFFIDAGLNQIQFNVNAISSTKIYGGSTSYAQFALNASGSSGTGEAWIGSNRLRYSESTNQFQRSSATEQGAMLVINESAQFLFYTQPSTTQTGTYSLDPRLTIDGDGNITQDLRVGGGETVFNTTGKAADFRVESDTNQNMLFVDGTNNKVVIGSNTIPNVSGTSPRVYELVLPTGLSIGDSNFTHGYIGNAGTDGDVMIAANAYAANLGNSRHVYISGGTSGGGFGEIASFNRDTGVVFNEEAAPGPDFRVESDSNTYMFFVDSGANRVAIGTSSVANSSSALLTIENNVSVNSNAPGKRGSIVIGESGSGTGEHGGVEIMQSSGGGAGYGIRWQVDSNGTGHSLQTRSNSSTWSEQLRIKSGGDIVGNTFFAGSAEYVGDVDDLKKTGFYRSYNGNANNPTYTYYSIVVYGNQGNVTAQIATKLAGNETYVRAFNTSWSSWQRLDT